VFGVIIVASTLYDVLTTTSLRRLIHRSAVVNDDDDDYRNGLITDQQTPVFGTADDQPLILTTTPSYTQGSKILEIYLFDNF